MAEETGGFLSRWARRKEQARSDGQTTPEPSAAAVAPIPPAPAAVALPIAAREPESVAEPLPTMADVALLSRESDYSRFVASGVDEGVKHAAMRKLFADPHFNVMDGLDTYIADYGQPDPIPMAMLRQMSQSKFLRLFDDDEEEEKNDTNKIAAPSNPAAPVSESANPSDDDPDLRLQQDDAAGRPGAGEGARA